MFSRSKEPGAPVLPSGSVVLFADPKQGHLLVPLSIGCLMLTPIGATYCALFIRLARAVAVALTVTVLTPQSVEKTPAAGFVSDTVIVSLRKMPLEHVTASGFCHPPF